MQRVTDRYTFFFRPESPFSQWHPSRFEVDGVAFRCAEQFMMHGKARLFDDAEVAAEILAATTPREHKALGRKVRGFDDAVWRRERERIVYQGSRAKFGQDPALRAALLATRGTELVEASPYDRIWGVGLSMDDPAIDDPASWRGKNLLGRILTRLRDELIAEGADAVLSAP
jgi:ribA/ribD-fused uncharacterized protein